MSGIDLAGFDAKFTGDGDPWATFSDRDEAIKREAILHALGAAPLGRVLELASGNGSNSVAIAPRALRLDATEGTRAGTALTARAIAAYPRAKAIELALPARFPRNVFDAVLIAELLYYLSPAEMVSVARQVARSLRPGSLLVLAHHRIDFHDFAQHAAGIHRRFLDATHIEWRVSRMRRSGRWIVERCVAVDFDRRKGDCYRS
jgi:SAM-dependent methyltransferase